MFLTKGKNSPRILHHGSCFHGEKNGKEIPQYGKDRGTYFGSVDCALGLSLFGLFFLSGSYHVAKFYECDLDQTTSRAGLSKYKHRVPACSLTSPCLDTLSSPIRLAAPGSEHHRGIVLSLISYFWPSASPRRAGAGWGGLCVFAWLSPTHLDFSHSRLWSSSRLYRATLICGVSGLCLGALQAARAGEIHPVIHRRGRTK